MNLVESIPEGMDYGNETVHPSIFESWLQLIEMAENSIDIAACYFSLRGVDVIPHPSAWQVCKIYLCVYYYVLLLRLQIHVNFFVF